MNTALVERKNLLMEPDADCIGPCDCCGKTGPLLKTAAFGYEHRACDICRGEADLEARADAIARFESEIAGLTAMRSKARTLWVKSFLTDAIADIRRMVEDLKEGNL